MNSSQEEQVDARGTMYPADAAPEKAPAGMTERTSDLIWSETPPHREGWWWLRDAFRNRPAEVVEVTTGPDGDLWFDDGCVAVDEVSTGTEWAGPIPEPTVRMVQDDFLAPEAP